MGIPRFLKFFCDKVTIYGKSKNFVNDKNDWIIESFVIQ